LIVGGYLEQTAVQSHLDPAADRDNRHRSWLLSRRCGCARLRNCPIQREAFMMLSSCNPTPLIMLLALTLSGCGDKPPPPVAAAPPVTVAQPVKRTVTDWDEFTGRFEAVEEVQVRARVGGFVTSVEFRDGAFVNTGDLLYTIDSRPFEAVAEQADGQLADARAKVELAKRDLDRGLTLVQTSAVSEQVVDQRRQSLQAATRPSCRAGRPTPPRPWPKAR
jgi:multidrug efflux pump subunit AcrA (membrane-fusion protein)